MHRPLHRALPAALVPLVLAGCGSDDPAASGPGASSRLDASDRTLALEPTPVYQIGGFEAPDWATFGSIRAARFDGQGNLYVLDSQANRVTVISPEGELLRTVGKPGEGPGELSSPFGFVVLPDGGVAVFDFSHRGFVVYGADGEYERTVTVDVEGVGLPTGDLLLHPDGGALSGLGGQIRISGGGRIDTGPATRPVAYYPLAGEGDARVVYEAWDLPEPPETEQESLQVSGGRSVTLAMPAERAFEPGLGVGVMPDGTVAVADSLGYRLKLVDLQGQVVRTLERPIPPTEVTETIQRQERERRLDAMAEGGGPRMMVSFRSSGPGGSGGGGGGVDEDAVRRMQERRLENMTFGEVIPVIENIAVEPTGRIWVQRSSGVPGEDGPTDILTADGRYLGTIPADGVRIPEAFGPDGLMVRIVTDDLDVATLVVERLPEMGGEETDG